MSSSILVCAATADELRAFHPNVIVPDDPDADIAIHGRFHFAVTGVGIPCTMLRLPSAIERARPEMVLNIGIAGAYPDSGLNIGDVALVCSERFGDIGFELPDAPGFRHISEAPFGRSYRSIPLLLDPEFASYDAARGYSVARGCTVNCCTGTRATGLLRAQLFEADIETMEGAAVALVAEAAGIACCQVRAISNIASDRDMRPGNIRLALERLAQYLNACLRRIREGAAYC